MSDPLAGWRVTNSAAKRPPFIAESHSSPDQGRLGRLSNRSLKGGTAGSPLTGTAEPVRRRLRPQLIEVLPVRRGRSDSRTATTGRFGADLG